MLQKINKENVMNASFRLRQYTHVNDIRLRLLLYYTCTVVHDKNNNRDFSERETKEENY